jgi:uncharacterized protein
VAGCAHPHLVVPLAAVAPGDTSPEVTVEMRREGDTVTVHYGAGPDAAPDSLLRLAYFPPGKPAEAGPMCASPDGTGFTSRFTSLLLEQP